MSTLIPTTPAKAAYIADKSAAMVGRAYTRSMRIGSAHVTVRAVRARTRDEIPLLPTEGECDVMVEYSGSVAGQPIGGCARLEWFVKNWSKAS